MVVHYGDLEAVHHSCRRGDSSRLLLQTQESHYQSDVPHCNGPSMPKPWHKGVVGQQGWHMILHTERRSPMQLQNLPMGTPGTKTINISRKTFVNKCINELLPAIEKEWPSWSPKNIITQREAEIECNTCTDGLPWCEYRISDASPQLSWHQLWGSCFLSCNPINPTREAFKNYRQADSECDGGI